MRSFESARLAERRTTMKFSSRASDPSRKLPEWLVFPTWVSYSDRQEPRMNTPRVPCQRPKRVRFGQLFKSILKFAPPVVY